MPALKNLQHEKFVQELVKGSSQGDAYLSAGYKAKSVAVASAAATRLLNDVKICARLEELKKKAEDKTVLSRSWVLERLMENVHRAMTAIAVTDREGETTGEYKYEGSVANKALELLGKEIGMFINKSEIGQPGDFDQMSDEELDQFIAVKEEIVQAKPSKSKQKPSTRH
jgi:hypothetical protein